MQKLVVITIRITITDDMMKSSLMKSDQTSSKSEIAEVLMNIRRDEFRELRIKEILSFTKLFIEP